MAVARLLRRRRVLVRRAERAAHPRSVSPPPDPGVRPARPDGPQSLPPGGGLGSMPSPPPGAGTAESAPPTAPAPRSEAITPEDAPQVGVTAQEVSGAPSLYSRFLASLEAPGTRRAYQGDLGLFARWLGCEPASAMEGLVQVGEEACSKIVQRWLNELRAQGLSVSVRNRRLAALKALVKFASDAEVCGWNLQISGERSQPRSNISSGITPDGIRYAGMQEALSSTARRFTQEQLLDLLQPQEVACLRFTRER